MKQNTKSNFMILLSSFFTSAVLSSIAVIAVKYYSAFAWQTAGSYSIATLFGDPLRDFLIKALLIAAGILAFITFAVKAKKCNAPKNLYPFYMIAMGVLWLALPFISVYSISRFTGALITQTVSGIAIIANVVFMMISVCCGIIAVTDVIHNLLVSCGNNSRANRCAAYLTGIPTGGAFAFLLASVLQSSIGLSGVFILFGALAVIIGIADLLFDKAAYSNEK